MVQSRDSLLQLRKPTVDQRRDLIGNREVWVQFDGPLTVAKSLVRPARVIEEVSGTSQNYGGKRLELDGTMDDLYHFGAAPVCDGQDFGSEPLTHLSYPYHFSSGLVRCWRWS
jgi:hypothetical protein